jgi:hypothetical protein
MLSCLAYLHNPPNIRWFHSSETGILKISESRGSVPSSRPQPRVVKQLLGRRTLLRKPGQHLLGKVDEESTLLAVKHGGRVREARHLIRDEFWVLEDSYNKTVRTRFSGSFSGKGEVNLFHVP